MTVAVLALLAGGAEAFAFSNTYDCLVQILFNPDTMKILTGKYEEECTTEIPDFRVLFQEVTTYVKEDDTDDVIDRASDQYEKLLHHLKLSSEEARVVSGGEEQPEDHRRNSKLKNTFDLEKLTDKMIEDNGAYTNEEDNRKFVSSPLYFTKPTQIKPRTPGFNEWQVFFQRLDKEKISELDEPFAKRLIKDKTFVFKNQEILKQVEKLREIAENKGKPKQRQRAEEGSETQVANSGTELSSSFSDFIKASEKNFEASQIEATTPKGKDQVFNKESASPFRVIDGTQLITEDSEDESEGEFKSSKTGSVTKADKVYLQFEETQHRKIREGTELDKFVRIPKLPIQWDNYRGAKEDENFEFTAISSLVFDNGVTLAQKKRHGDILKEISQLLPLLPNCLLKALMKCNPLENINKVVQNANLVNKDFTYTASGIVGHIQCSESETFFQNACYKICPEGFEDYDFYCLKPMYQKRSMKKFDGKTILDGWVLWGNKILVTDCKTFGPLFKPISSDYCRPTCPQGWKSFGNFCQKPFRFRNQPLLFVDKNF